MQLGVPSPKLTWQQKIHRLKMYFLLKMWIFEYHVSFHGGKKNKRTLKPPTRKSTFFLSTPIGSWNNTLLLVSLHVWSTPAGPIRLGNVGSNDPLGHNGKVFGWLRIKWLHPRKLTCPLKRDYFNRKDIFQPLIFRGHVSFPGCI